MDACVAGPSRWLRALIAPLVLAAAAGCGSTVSLGSQGAPGGELGGGLPPAAGTASTLPGATALPGGASAPGAIGGVGPPAATTAGPDAGPAGSTGGASTSLVGPGVTATTITIGLVYATNSTAADEAMGANNLAAGDDQAEVRAVVNDINRRGGVAGRNLVILPYGEDATSTQPYAVTAAQMCSFMTQDHHVLAVVGSGFGDAKACLNRAGTAQFNGQLIGLSDSDGKSQIDFATGAMNIDRSMLAEVRAWTVANWFSPWNTVTGTSNPAGTFKMGILTVDEPPLNHAVDRVLIPALVRAGHPAPAAQDIIRLHQPASAGDDGNVVAQIQNSVLKFRQDNVDHVVILDSNGSATLLFANDAYSQRYFPRLGGGSGNAFQALLESGNVQQQSLVGAVAAGWAPVVDVPYSNSDMYESAEAGRCRAVMKANGLTFSNANAESFALGYCDVFNVLVQALANVPSLTALGLAQGAERIGRSLPSALMLGLNVAAGHHDGAGAFYADAYQDSCSCFGYKGPLQLI